MNKNRGTYVLLLLILLSVLGWGTYYLHSKGIIFNKTKETKEQTEGKSGYKTEKGLSFDLISPKPNSKIGCDFVLAGKMPREWFFENSFQYSILINDKEIMTGSVESNDDYTVEEILSFSKSISCKEGCLGDGEIVLQNNNPSGLDENHDEYRIPVTFTSTCSVKEAEKKEIVEEPTKTVSVKIYFSNSVEDPNSEKCEKTHYVVRRITETVAVGKASLTELLKGPNITERGKGYYTSIPIGTELKSLNIKNGVAYANFNEKLTEGVGGTCLTSKIRSQIENTLKQFPTVKEVQIEVNGKTLGVLEP